MNLIWILIIAGVLGPILGFLTTQGLSGSPIFGLMMIVGIALGLGDPALRLEDPVFPSLAFLGVALVPFFLVRWVVQKHRKKNSSPNYPSSGAF